MEPNEIRRCKYCPKNLNEKLANLVAGVEILSSSNQNITISIINDNNVLVKKEVELAVGNNKIDLDFIINKPIFWYPATHGNPHLYSIKTIIEMNGKTIEKNTKIGLRTIKVIHEEDKDGKSFYFEVNGKPMFMKGANWIPADIFLTDIKEDEYRHLIQSSIDANMNMLRVWGGGIYEEDRFYELCDEMGILIWQDFMFACSKVPVNDYYLKNLKIELIQNVKRLRNHPSIAIWCGNNEIEWLTFRGSDTTYTKTWWESYGKIFHNFIPEVLKEVDTTRFYHSGSPSANLMDYKTANKIGYGDKHDWGIWHGQEEPYENFEKNTSRFMSEFGFQSFPTYATMDSFAENSDWDIESEVMKAHQKCVRGNEKIQLYWDRDFKEAKDFQSFIYGNQVLQAIIIQYALESHRRKMPYCMGSLYWQLNDCWPVASWSSIDHLGKWKALHYFVKKAFSPVLVSPKIENDKIQIFIISDKLKDEKARLTVQLMDFNGKVLNTYKSNVVIKQNTSQEYLLLDKTKFLKNNDPRKVLVYVKVTDGSDLISSSYLYFNKVKELDLPTPNIKYEIDQEDGKFVIELKTDKLAKNIYLAVGKDRGFFSDNFFDLLPGESKKVVFTPDVENLDLEKELVIKSLVDVFK